MTSAIRTSRGPRMVGLIATTVALTLVCAGARADPAAAAPTATGPTSSVTLFLAAPDATGLRALAARPVTDRAQRMQQLSAVVPSASQRDAVVRDLTSRGFTVVDQSAWSVRATAPASLVSGLIGSRPRAAANAALPAVPSALSGLVSAVYPTTGGPAAFHQAAAVPLTGADVRNADAAAGLAPSTGTHDAALTIATLQLSSWNASDLTAYATSHGLPDPVASGQYRAVTVDGGPTDSSGDVEVDIDQESLLSTAPSANQQAYFAPNTEAGFDDVFSHVYDDVTGNSMATAVDPHIAAMSVSWGECEAFTGATSIAALEPILDSLVAAGVTLFTSSGDDGIYDCRSASGTGADDSQEDVDYPSSSPAAVAVGGTKLTKTPGGPNLGNNWTESSWTCTSTTTCEDQDPEKGTGGTGGGVSGEANGKSILATPPSTFVTGDFAGFAKPTYQSAITNAPFATVAKRMVPDIAADGDPETGFVITTSDPAYAPTAQFGGTSLAAPLSAAQFTNTLGDAGRAHGVGDIHAALYQAYTATSAMAAEDPLKVFRDITVGTNGATAHHHIDPSVSAGPGYDTNTGLGAVLWPALAPYLPGSIVRGGTIGATATATLSKTGRKHHKHKVVVFTWSTTAPPAATLTTSVSITKSGAAKFATLAGSGVKQLKGRGGKTYVITVSTVDQFGDHTDQTAHVKVPKKKKKKHHHRHRRHPHR